MNPTKHFKKLAALVAAAILTAAPARADYSTTFAIPPYQLDATVLGIDGWEPRQGDAAAAGPSAMLRAVRWNNYAPAMVLKKASLKNAFPKTTGTKVLVTAKMAITFPQDGGNLQVVRIIISGAPFGEIVFDASKATGGLGFGDGGGRKTQVLVPFTEMKPNSFYTFAILVDYDHMTYDLNVTGERRDGTPVKVEKKSEPFQSKKTFMEGLLILSGGVTTYISELSLVSQ